MIFCEPERQAEVVTAMEQCGIRKMNFQFDEMGAHVLLDQREPSDEMAGAMQPEHFTFSPA